MRGTLSDSETDVIVVLVIYNQITSTGGQNDDDGTEAGRRITICQLTSNHEQVGSVV